MAAFIHWVTISFDRDDVIGTEITICDSFACATGLKPYGRKATGKILSDYYAKSGVQLTQNGSYFLHLQRANKSLFIICGKDCENIRSWQALHNFIEGLPNVKITRIDLAIDVQELTLNDIQKAYTENQFFTSGRKPTIQHIGQFVLDDDTPRTITIGKREYGKCFRAYEIGRKYNLKKRNTIRLEVELHGSTRIIPIDILINQHSYFCGTYPYLHTLNKGNVCITDTRRQITESNYDDLIKNLRNSYGQMINLMTEVEQSAEAIIKLILRPGYPKGISASDIQNLKKRQARPESQPELLELRVLRLLTEAPLPKSVISSALGHKKISGHLNKVIRVLLSDQFLEYTHPSKPNSRLQQYRLTETGRLLSAALQKTNPQ